MSEEGGDTPDSISAMFLNPNAVNQRHARFNNQPGVTRPTVNIADTSEDADRWIRHERRYERGEDSNSPMESEEGAEEYEDDEPAAPSSHVGTGSGTHKGNTRLSPSLLGGGGGGGSAPLNPVVSLAEQQSAEKLELIVRLNKYINSGISQITMLIPQQNYNLSTPLTVLREVVELCDRIMMERLKARNRDTGRKMIYSGITFLANFMETMNTKLLDPESQFALDKFGEFTEKEVSIGTYEDCADGMWEKLAPYCGALTNPFLQFGIAFGGGMAKYVMERENAYRLGALPDPRPARRARLDAEMREEQLALENAEMEDGNSGGPPTNPYAAPGSYLPAPILSDNAPIPPLPPQQQQQAQRSKIGAAAAVPYAPPTSFSFPSGFESSDDEDGDNGAPSANDIANSLGSTNTNTGNGEPMTFSFQ